MKRILVLTLCLVFIQLGNNVQAQSSVKDSIQIRTFLIRNSIYFEKLAYRFNIMPKELRKYNKRAGEVLYKGKMVNIPIKVRPFQWDPSKFNSNKSFLGPEDARPQEEVEWDKEGIDNLLEYEVLGLNDIIADSIQFEKIETHVLNIDKRLTFLNYATDSIKKTEFAFDYDEKDVNAVIQRMAAARSRYYASTPMGKEIDSLKEIRSKLDEEMNRLRKNIGEYQYLIENAYYFEKAKDGLNDLKMYKAYYGEEKLAFESNYASGKMIPRLTARDRRILRKENKAQLKKAKLEQKESLILEEAKYNDKQQQKKTNEIKQVEHHDGNLIKKKDDLVENDENPFVLPKEKITDDSVEVAVTKDVEETETNTKIQHDIHESKVEVVENSLKVEAAQLSPQIELNSNDNDSKVVSAQERKFQDEKLLLEIDKEDVKVQEVVAVFEDKKQTKKNNSKANQTKIVNNEKSANSSVLIPVENLNGEEEVDIIDFSTDLNQLESSKSPNQVSSLLYANKISKTEHENKDEVDKLFDEKQIKLAPNSVKSYKVENIKGVPTYLIPKDSISKQKSMAFLNRFKSNILLDDQKTAIKDLEKALELDPTNRKAWTYHADLLLNSDSQIDAMKEYQIVLEIEPKNTEILYKVAQLYESVNNQKKAYEFYLKTIESDSFFSKAYMARADLSIRQGDRRAAQDDYTSLITILPNIPEPYRERGNLRLLERDYVGALSDYNEYFSISDPNGEVLFNRGMAKVYTGKIIEGCSDFSNAAAMGYSEALKALKKYCE